MIFIHALGRKVAELMSNTSQQRLEIPEHTGREVDTSGLQAGKGKPCLVGVKSFRQNKPDRGKGQNEGRRRVAGREWRRGA